MGAWGVTARESDNGLDTLALIEVKCLKPKAFKHFDVKAILDFCRNNIIEGIKKEEEPWLREDDDIQEYIDANLPHRYDGVIKLVALCLTEYSQNGVFLIEDYEAKAEIRITEFIYTDSVLDEILDELKDMLDPEHFEYTSWFEDADRQVWIAHMKMMCDSIASLKGGICHE